MTTVNRDNPITPTIGLFLLLLLIGSIYIASLGYFLAKGTNFVDRDKTESATKFAHSTSLTLPASLAFTTSSRWSPSLSAGWNAPEGWGVWSRRAKATIVLPPVQDQSITSACFTFRVGVMSSVRSWTMSIEVNGHPIAPTSTFEGAGPYDISGEAPIQPDDPIQVQMSGPDPQIPNLVSRDTMDSRDLAFRLLGISVAQQCTHGE